MRLNGRRILITGGASGIGLAIVRRFTAEGAQVAILDRQQNAETEKLASAKVAITYLADVRDDQAVRQSVEGAAAAMGGLDGIVNAAGATMVRRFPKLTPSEWNDTIAINLTGPFLVCHHAHQHLARAVQEGSVATIVNVASGAGLQPIPDRSAYCAAKGGLVMFSKALSIDLASIGIRVNALCPGLIDTPMVETSMRNSPDRDAEYARAMAYRLIKRLGTADEMADAALFLTSDESRYMTGSALSIDGGRAFY